MMVVDGEFHHVGVACADLDETFRAYQSEGYEQEGDEFEDPIQHVRGRFLVGPGERIEILVSSDDSKVLEPWLTGGPRPYHRAYLVSNIEKHLLKFQEDGARVVTSPVPAVAFGGRQIAFVMMRDMELIELIEAE